MASRAEQRSRCGAPNDGSGRVAVADLITRRFGVSDLHAALEVIKQRAAIKATIEP
jgi:threonine dehydrogenase-like Zn-dependent dehydrogenase